MAIRDEVVVVDGKRYMIEQFGAWQGSKLMKKVLKVAAPIIAALQDNTQGVATEVVIIRALSESLDNLDEATTKELFSKVYDDSNGKLVDVDTEFAGRYKHMFDLLWKVVEVNKFIDVFQEGEGTDAPAAPTEQ